jgi:hypothetical protein
MNGLGALCDEFYINSRLFLKLDLTPERETVLHFFDRIRKEYPRLRKLRRREDGAVLLEEEPTEDGSRRWLRLDPSSLRFGVVSPESSEEVRRFGELILAQAPYHFTFSDIEYDHLEVVYGFDLHYRGNHDQLVAETLFGEQAAMGFLFNDQAAHVIDAQPYFGIALSPECDLQAYVEVKSRTATYAVRNGAYDIEPISVLLTTRKYWGLDDGATVEGILAQLFEVTDDLATNRIVPHFVNPLAAAIASRS